MLLPFLLSLSITHGAEHFLAPDGSDAHPGTREKPWKSLQRSIWKLHAGDTLTVRGGSYRDASFGDLQTPSRGKVTTLRAAPGERVVFDGRVPARDALKSAWTRGSGNRWLAKTNPEWRRLDGLWVDGKYVPRVKQAQDLASGTWFFSNKASEATLELPSIDPNTSTLEFRLHSMIELDTPYWLVEGVKAQYYNYAGITVSSTHHVTIRRCELHHNGGSGIEADESTDLLIEGNHASYNGADGGPGWASGIHLWKTTSPRNVVRDNRSHHNWDPSDHHTDGNGFSIDRGGASGGAEVYGNTAFENGGRGLDIVEVANVRLHDNTFFSNSRDPQMADQGEVSISEAVSAQGLRLDRNTLKALGKNPPLVLFGTLNPASLRGAGNVFCNADSPELAVGVYKQKTWSREQWKAIPGVQLEFTQECR